MVADEGAFEAGFAAGDRVSIASGALSYAERSMRLCLQAAWA